MVTNPPFSLFREYVAQLVEYEKQFLIIGNKNALTYKDIFLFIKEEKMWLGYKNINSDMWLILPDDCETWEKMIDGKKTKHIMACWFTNLQVSKRNENLILYKMYEGQEGNYPKYDNYDAINIDKVSEIPADYDGIMGVPITFIDKHNPKQFEIVDGLNRYSILDTAGTNQWARDNHLHMTSINGKSTYFRVLIRNLKCKKGTL